MARSVLVVDDDASFRELATRILTGWGHTVVGEAGDVEQALSLAARLKPDVALVDIGLPDGDGFTLTQQLRAMPRPPLVLLISSDSDRAILPAAYRAGASGFFPKDDVSGVEFRQMLERAASSGGIWPQLRVAVGEDDVLLREGIVRILTGAGLDVVAQAGDADELLNLTMAYRPDVVIVDVRMPPRHEDDGLRAAIEIRRRLPATGVLILSQHLEPPFALDLIGDRPEGVGYLLKERVGDVDSFIGAVNRVAAGGSALDAEVVARMLGRPAAGGDLLHALTPRERAVLAAMAQGKSNAGIARGLIISEAAVEKHVTAIFRKLGIGPASTEHRRVHAVLMYLHDHAGGR